MTGAMTGVETRCTWRQGARMVCRPGHRDGHGACSMSDESRRACGTRRRRVGRDTHYPRAPAQCVQ